MSGNSPEMVETAFPLQEGINFIQKPFHPRDLVNLIGSLLEE
jgi:hypothetical protein